MTLLPVDEALNRILARVPDVVGENVALAGAAGRVLAEQVVARRQRLPLRPLSNQRR